MFKLSSLKQLFQQQQKEAFLDQLNLILKIWFVHRCEILIRIMIFNSMNVFV